MPITRRWQRDLNNRYDTLGGIIKFEDGSASEDEVIELFQHLVDSGSIHNLQGSYQRTAQSLINEGLVKVH